MGRAALEVIGTAFFYGTLGHLPLLRVVLGRLPEIRSARWPDMAVFLVEGRDVAVAEAMPGGVVDGVVAVGLSKADHDRLEFFAAGFALSAREVTVHVDGEEVLARTFMAGSGLRHAGRPWLQADWQTRCGALAVATAEDIMVLYNQVPARDVIARQEPMRVRAASRLRAAAAPAPTAVRRDTGPEEVTVVARGQPYARFFAIEEYQLSYPRFDGSQSEVVNRAAFISGDAVTVLPYDPVRDRVLLVEQFRAGPFARGDRRPWSLEAVAGRIDPGETAEEAARREAVEEAGLTLGALLPVANYYSSPGAKTEYLYSFVAIADLPDGAAGVFGVAEEAEDIRGHLIGFEEVMALVASGEVNNGPLILTALWLERERARLREM